MPPTSGATARRKEHATPVPAPDSTHTPCQGAGTGSETTQMRRRAYRNRV